MSSPYLSRMVNVGLALAVIVPVIIAIFEFSGIPFETYGNYVFWFVGLGIIYTFMPSASRKLFASTDG
jgi:hypothetical protein